MAFSTTERAPSWPFKIMTQTLAVRADAKVHWGVRQMVMRLTGDASFMGEMPSGSYPTSIPQHYDPDYPKNPLLDRAERFESRADVEAEGDGRQLHPRGRGATRRRAAIRPATAPTAATASFPAKLRALGFGSPQAAIIVDCGPPQPNPSIA